MNFLTLCVSFLYLNQSSFIIIIKLNIVKTTSQPTKQATNKKNDNLKRKFKLNNPYRQKRITTTTKKYIKTCRHDKRTWWWTCEPNTCPILLFFILIITKTFKEKKNSEKRDIKLPPPSSSRRRRTFGHRHHHQDNLFFFLKKALRVETKTVCVCVYTHCIAGHVLVNIVKMNKKKPGTFMTKYGHLSNKIIEYNQQKKTKLCSLIRLTWFLF